MLVNLTRIDGSLLAINPRYVSAIANSAQHQGAAVLKLADGRGYLVVGTVETVLATLSGEPVEGELDSEAEGEVIDFESRQQ